MQVVEKPEEAVAVIRLFLLITFLSGQLLAQKREKKLPPPELQIIYSYYMQDGSNSAVTGGTGTEELDFHGPAVQVHIPTDSTDYISIAAGVDVYSSASQDNIDFVMSSASSIDARTHIKVGYQKSHIPSESDYGVHGSFSIESDYTSFGFGGFYSKGFNNYNSTLTLSAQAFIDDCRWGRLSSEDQLTLIYPVELRGIDWEDEYMRYTATLSLAYNQILTKRLNVGFYVDGVWQSGLLATTFHRIFFFDDDQHVIERLPYERFKLPIALRLNYFATRHLLLRTYYRFYADSWNLNAHTIELEPVVKVSPFFSLFPYYRWYWQQAVFWFNPYRQHSVNQDFYTSDYDLSGFTAHKIGLGFHWHPLNGFSKKPDYGWQSWEMRLGTYLRSDGLQAFYVSTIFHVGE